MDYFITQNIYNITITVITLNNKIHFMTASYTLTLLYD